MHIWLSFFALNPRQWTNREHANPTQAALDVSLCEK